MSSNKKQGGYKNIDDTDFNFEPNTNDINSSLKEQHTLDFYNDDMSRKAVKSMFEINNENNDQDKVEPKKTYGYNGTNKHNTFSNPNTPSKPNKPVSVQESKPVKTDKNGNIEYTGVSFDYDKLNAEAKQGYRYGGAKKEIDFRNTAFSVEKLNAEKKAREEAELNKQKLRQLEMEERSRAKSPTEFSSEGQYRTVGEFQQSFDTLPMRRVSAPLASGNNSKRKQIMTIRIGSTIFMLILFLCLVVNIIANTKLKSQIDTLTTENETLKTENAKIQDLNNEVTMLTDELTKLKAGVTPPEATETNTPESQAPKEYVVKSGDSLSSISRAFYGDPNRYTDIMSANNLSSETLFSGQKLIIP